MTNLTGPVTVFVVHTRRLTLTFRPFRTTVRFTVLQVTSRTTPCFPVRPFAPATPVTPITPVEPVRPAAPAAPVEPVGARRAGHALR